MRLTLYVGGDDEGIGNEKKSRPGTGTCDAVVAKNNQSNAARTPYSTRT